MSDKILNKYSKLYSNIYKYDNEEDYEKAHIYTEEIYRKFIKDISNNKFNNIEDIVKIAKDIKKKIILYEKDKQRWYA